MWERWIKTSLLAAFVVCIYGVFQFMGLAGTHGNGARLDSFFGNPTILAPYLLFHIFFAACLLAGIVFRGRAIHIGVDQIGEEENKSLKPQIFAYSFFILLGIFILVETGTRGSLLGLVAGIILFLFLIAIIGKGSSKTVRRYSLVAVILFGVVIASFIFARNSRVVSASPILSRLSSVSELSVMEYQPRLYVWKIAFEGFLDRPIFGWGQENFRYIFQAHYDPALYVESWYDRAHDVFLEWLSAGGILGFLAYISLFIFLSLAICKSRLNFIEKSLLSGLILAYAVSNIFEFDTLATYLPFIALLGFANSFSAAVSIDFARKRDVGIKWALPIVAILLVASVYYLNLKPLLANYYLAQAHLDCAEGNPDISLFKKSLSENSFMGRTEIRSDLLTCSLYISKSTMAGKTSSGISGQLNEFATDQFKDEVAENANNAQSLSIFGSYLMQVGDFKGAENYLKRANDIIPRKATIGFDLTTDYLYEDKNDEAILTSQSAYKTNPSDEMARLVYSAVLALSGKNSQAEAVAEDGTSTIRMIEDYVSEGDRASALNVYGGIFSN